MQLRTAAAKAVQKGKNMAAADFVSLLTSLSSMEEPSLSLASIVAKRAPRCAPQLRPRHLGVVVHALAALRLNVPVKLMAALRQSAELQAADFLTGDWCMLCAGVSKLEGYGPQVQRCAGFLFGDESLWSWQVLHQFMAPVPPAC
jgi:hypothetical protein